MPPQTRYGRSEALTDPDGQGRRVCPGAQGEGGISPPPLKKRRFPSLYPFLFDPTASQEEVAQLLSFAQDKDLSGSPSLSPPCRQGAARGWGRSRLAG